MEGKPKLHYFKLYGRAEPIRFALSALGIDYEDVELNGKFTGGEEGEKEWQETKKKFEFEQVPVLDIDGKSLSQSRAILRYLFQREGLYPTDKYEVYRLESLVDLYGEIEAAIFKTIGSPDRDAAMKDFFTTTFPLRMTQLEKRLKENSTQDYLVGDKLSTVDCLVCNLRYTFLNPPDEEKKKMIEAAFAQFETVNKYLETRKASFAKRLETRPKYHL